MQSDREGPPLLIPVRQAAATLGLGRDSCYRLIREGRLPAVRVGRRLLVPRSSLKAWAEEQARSGLA